MQICASLLPEYECINVLFLMKVQYTVIVAYIYYMLDMYMYCIATINVHFHVHIVCPFIVRILLEYS